MYSMNELTPRRSAILNFIRERIAEQGQPPSLAEIAEALATASDTPRIAFAPRRALFSVPSSSIRASSMRRWSSASKPDRASKISPFTASTAFWTPLPR